MTRDEMIEKLMNEHPKDFPSKAAAERTIVTIFDLIKEEVAAGRDVTVSQFGRFYSYQTKATTARNIATGEKIKVPAKRVPKFKAAESFKNAVK